MEAGIARTDSPSGPRFRRRLLAGAITWSLFQTILTMAAPAIGGDSVIAYGAVTLASLLASWLLPFAIVRVRVHIVTVLSAATTIGLAWYVNPLRLLLSLYPEEVYVYYFLLAVFGLGIWHYSCP